MKRGSLLETQICALTVNSVQVYNLSPTFAAISVVRSLLALPLWLQGCHVWDEVSSTTEAGAANHLSLRAKQSSKW